MTLHQTVVRIRTSFADIAEPQNGVHKLPAICPFGIKKKNHFTHLFIFNRGSETPRQSLTNILLRCFCNITTPEWEFILDLADTLGLIITAVNAQRRQSRLLLDFLIWSCHVFLRLASNYRDVVMCAWSGFGLEEGSPAPS